MKKVILVFPGQGSQYVGMGKDLYDNFEYIKNIYDTSSDILGIDINRISFYGSEEELKNTENAQVCIFLHSAAILEIIKKEVGSDIRFIACAGHSLGEYSALYSANVFSLEDCLRIVRKRGELMANADPEKKGGMAAVIGLDSQKIREICNEMIESNKYVEPVNYNSPDQTVISGLKEAIKEVSEKLKLAGAKRVIELAVSGAFHSKLMENVAKDFGNFLHSFNFNKPDIPVLSNYNAEFYKENKEEIIELLVRQMYSPVLWTEIVNKFSSLEHDFIIEVGPGQVLKGLIKKTNPNLNVITTNNLEGIKELINNIKNTLS